MMSGETNVEQAVTSMPAGDKPSTEGQTTTITNTTSFTTQRHQVVQPFKVPRVPPLRTKTERSVEHIHFDKKWAAKKGQPFSTHLLEVYTFFLKSHTLLASVQNYCI